MKRFAIPAIALGAALVFVPAPTRAALAPDEVARLMNGEAIVEETVIERNDRRFVGGLSYLVVEADAARLSTLARDVRRFAQLLPHVSDAKLLGLTPAGRAKVRVTHEVGPFHGGYTIVIGFEDEGRLGRFWIDRTADNDVDDAWGFVRLTPLAPTAKGDRTLVTYAILFDLGPGVLRTMFESRIQKAALDYPRRLADAAH
jgi:hypothetical protein